MVHVLRFCAPFGSSCCQGTVPGSRLCPPLRLLPRVHLVRSPFFGFVCSFFCGLVCFDEPSSVPRNVAAQLSPPQPSAGEGGCGSSCRSGTRYTARSPYLVVLCISFSLGAPLLSGVVSLSVRVSRGLAPAPSPLGSGPLGASRWALARPCFAPGSAL